MSHSEVASTECYNCGAVLQGAYCGTCGQRAQPLNPSLQDFLHELTHELLHVDGKIFRSVRRLLFSPGFLTREQFEGRRSRWMNPIRLYLIFSLLYFGAAALASTQEMRVHVSGTTAQEEAEGLQRFGYASQQEAEEALAHARAKWAPRVMFLLVPFYAWLIQLTARRSGRNYPQHLYFALHVHAAWFALGALAAAVSLVLPAVASRVVSTLLVVCGLTYAVLAYRTAYQRTILESTWRSMIVLLVYWIATIATLLAILLPVLFWHR